MSFYRHGGQHAASPTVRLVVRRLPRCHLRRTGRPHRCFAAVAPGAATYPDVRDTPTLAGCGRRADARHDSHRGALGQEVPSAGVGAADARPQEGGAPGCGAGGLRHRGHEVNQGGSGRRHAVRLECTRELAPATACAARANTLTCARRMVCDQAEPLPGFAPAKPMVFASIFPVDSGDFEDLQAAVRATSPPLQWPPVFPRGCRHAALLRCSGGVLVACPGGQASAAGSQCHRGAREQRVRARCAPAPASTVGLRGAVAASSRLGPAPYTDRSGSGCAAGSSAFCTWTCSTRGCKTTSTRP